jgi:hypothetical protein
MAVAHVATGTVVNTGSAVTTMAVTSPAGSAGELLLAFLSHDDHSDGLITNDDGALTWTDVVDTTTKRGDDSRQQVLWAVETQTSARAFDFVWSTSEEAKGVILRYSGQHSTPIAAGAQHMNGTGYRDKSVAARGDMAVYTMMVDGTATFAFEKPSSIPEPAGYTERLMSRSNEMSHFIADRAFGADDYPYPHVHHPSMVAGEENTSIHAPVTIWFVISSAAAASNTISGVTKDKDGSALGSCETYLMKENAAGDEMMFVAKTTSHSGTGAYSFTVVNDTDALFFVYSFKDDSPHVFDCTDHVLAPS